MNVQIQPMPAWARGVARYAIHHPPVFPDGPPTQAEAELALALFAELDSESQAWYGGEAFAARLRQRLEKA